MTDRDDTRLLDLADGPATRTRFGGLGAIGVALLVAAVLALIGLGFVVSSLIPTGTSVDGTTPLGQGSVPTGISPPASPVPSSAAPSPSATTSAASTSPSTAATTAFRPTPLEDEAVRLTNAARKAAGCPAVRLDAHLRTAAREHSTDMAQKRYFSHTGSDGTSFDQRVTAAGYRNPLSENIAEGYPTAAAVLQAWLNSPPHKANIVDCSAKAVGVGVARASNGAVLWTEDFGG